jgi:hypothetical protein
MTQVVVGQNEISNLPYVDSSVKFLKLVFLLILSVVVISRPRLKSVSAKLLPVVRSVSVRKNFWIGLVGLCKFGS